MYYNRSQKNAVKRLYEMAKAGRKTSAPVLSEVKAIEKKLTADEIELKRIKSLATQFEESVELLTRSDQEWLDAEYEKKISNFDFHVYVRGVLLVIRISKDPGEFSEDHYIGLNQIKELSVDHVEPKTEAVEIQYFIHDKLNPEIVHTKNYGHEIPNSKYDVSTNYYISYSFKVGKGYNPIKYEILAARSSWAFQIVKKYPDDVVKIHGIKDLVVPNGMGETVMKAIVKELRKCQP